MLNDNKSPRGARPHLSGKSIVARALFILWIALFCLLLQNNVELEAAAPAKGEQFATTKTEDRTAFRTKYVSLESGMLIAVRPKEIFELPEFDRMASFMSRGPMGNSDIDVKDLETVLMAQSFEEVELPEKFRREGMPKTVSMPSQTSLYMSLAKEYDTAAFDKMFPFLGGEAIEKERGEETYVLAEYDKPNPFGGNGPDGEDVEKATMAKWHPTKRSIVVADGEAMKRIIDGEPLVHPMSESPHWKSFSKSMLVVAIDSTMLKQYAKMVEADKKDPMAAMIAPIVKSAETAYFSVDVQKDIRAKIVLVCKNQQAATDTKKLITELLIVGKKLLSMQADSPNKSLRETVLFFTDVLDDMKVSQTRSEVRISVASDFEKFILGPFFDSILGAQSAAKSVNNMNNLKQHALAAHNYASAYGHFPPAVVVGPNGHKHSWRVAVLPFLEEGEMFKDYRMEEAWDSEHNKQFISKMPAVFRHPDDPEDSTSSRYYALVGPGTVMGGAEGMKLSEIKDGTSRTILYVEAKRDFPWTKPDDIAYDPSAVPDVDQSGFIAAFADGSVRRLEDVDPAELHSMIQVDDGGDTSVDAAIDSTEVP